MRPATPGLRTACTLHEEGGRSPPVLNGRSGSVCNVEGMPTSGGPNDADAAGATERASATTTRPIRMVPIIGEAVIVRERLERY
jgi:hypothetical protein